MTMTAEQLAQLREVAANLKDVARHSVDGYGRQDIHYNDPEGEFVFYSDYAALLDELERKNKRIAELEEQLCREQDYYLSVDMDRMELWKKLEARTVTVKLPPCVGDLHGIGMVMSADAVVEALKASGINLTAEG